MPSGDAALMPVIVLGVVLYFGGVGVWHGLKKLGHGVKESGQKITCMVQHGRKCLKK